jgi:hypothetical protein
MLPGELSAKPLPVTVTLCMPTSPLSGFTVRPAEDWLGEGLAVVDVALVDGLLEHAPSPTVAKATVTPAAILVPKPISAPFACVLHRSTTRRPRGPAWA